MSHARLAIIFLVGAAATFLLVTTLLFSVTPPPVKNEGNSVVVMIPMQGVREGFITVNADLAELCEQIKANCQAINVGSAPNAGDGDPVPVALGKIAENLRLIEAYVGPITTESQADGIH